MIVADAEHLKLFCLLCLILGATSASPTINGSSASNWPATGGSSIYLTGQIGPTDESCTKFKVRAGATAAIVTRWVSETSIAFRTPAAASSRIVFAATSSTSACAETHVPVPRYPVTYLAFTKVTAGQGMGCAITSGGALYCWGCFSGMIKGSWPKWRKPLIGTPPDDSDIKDQYHCNQDDNLPAGPSLPTLVVGMESGVTQVTHLSTWGTIQTKGHMGLVLKSGKVYELFLDTSRGSTQPGFIAARLYQSSTFTGIVSIADSRQGQGAYSCAVRADTSIYCYGSSQTPVNRIENLPNGFVPISVHCSHYFDPQHCCTYNTQGVVYCWGRRSMQGCTVCNRLGDAETDLSKHSDKAVLAGVVSATSIPVASGQPLVVSMDIGYTGTYVVGGDGKIYCWACRNTNSLTLVANAPSGQKYLKVTAYSGAGPPISGASSRICALTSTSRLYCAIVPSGDTPPIGSMLEVTSVRNSQRQVVQLSTTSGVLDVSCSKYFAASAGPYMSCCIIVRSSLGSSAGGVHCTVCTQGPMCHALAAFALLSFDYFLLRFAFFDCMYTSF